MSKWLMVRLRKLMLLCLCITCITLTALRDWGHSGFLESKRSMIRYFNLLIFKIPIILVGNKVDLRSSHSDNNLESMLNPFFMDFKQVEMGIECSAKGYMNLIDIIYCAQRAVLFPISPLFDTI